MPFVENGNGSRWYRHTPFHMLYRVGMEIDDGVRDRVGLYLFRHD